MWDAILHCSYLRRYLISPAKLQSLLKVEYLFHFCVLPKQQLAHLRPTLNIYWVSQCP